MQIVFEIAGAAIAATAATQVYVDLTRTHRLAERRRHRRRGTGPYAPTSRIPRDVDLQLAIADHLRLHYRPLVDAYRAINQAWRELGLGAAAAVARAMQPSVEDALSKAAEIAERHGYAEEIR